MHGPKKPAPSMFTAKDLNIFNGTFNQFIDHDVGRQGFDLLSDNTSPHAFYNSGNAFIPRCHPNTRIAILDRLQAWLQVDANSADPGSSILWLYGAAGAGKTTIARSIAQLCDEQKLLLASFFFFRSDESRNSVKNFIPSLAYSISQTVPGSRQSIDQAMRSDPHIFSKSLDVQLRHLIIEPLSHYRLNNPSEAQPEANVVPHVFIIDGLDECLDREGQKDVIQLFASIPNEILGWRILIASRPERAICSAFDKLESVSPLTRISLSQEYHGQEDIRLYLEDKFAEIKHEHLGRSYIPAEWPSPDDITRLVTESSGQFIFASTVIRYVSLGLDSPVNRLRSMLNVRNTNMTGANTDDSPFADLDNLYAHIIETASARLPPTVSRGLPNAVSIVVALSILLGPDAYFLSTWHESPVQALSRMLGIDIVVMTGILAELNSIISTEEDRIDVYHASLRDFLFNRPRSHALCVEESHIRGRILSYCLSTPKQNFKDPRAIWNILERRMSGIKWTREVCKCLYSFEFISAIEVTLCPGEMNDCAFMDAAMFLCELRRKASRCESDNNIWTKSYLRFVTQYDQWIAGRLDRLCQKTFSHRAYVSFFSCSYAFSFCNHELHLKRDSSLLPDDFLSGIEYEHWLELFDDHQLPHTRACVLGPKTREAGIWFCINYLVQMAVLDGAVRFSPDEDRRKLRPWLSRRRMYYRRGRRPHLPFMEEFDIRHYFWEPRKHKMNAMLAYVFPAVETLLDGASPSPRIVYALRVFDSLVYKQDYLSEEWFCFKRTVRRYLVRVAGLKFRRRSGFGFVGMANHYRFEGWKMFWNSTSAHAPEGGLKWGEHHEAMDYD